MRCLLIGLGSIGKRHLRILKEMLTLKIYCCRSGMGPETTALSDDPEVEHIYSIAESVAKQPDFAIISNPTALHLETALTLAQAGIPFLIEKPVSDRLDGLDTLQNIVQDKNLPVMVGFQLRHHPGYKQIIQTIKSGEIGQPVGLQGNVGQYLPDWHTGSDYRKSYSARKELGGGVILDLCHEIDIATSILGDVSKVSCMFGHYSELEIDTEDMADITMEHENRAMSHIHLNYIERGYEWVTRVTGSLGSIVWDYSRGYVEVRRSSDGCARQWKDPDGFERDWLFREQLKRWFEVLEGRAVPEVGLEEGINVTRIALAAKRSGLEGKHIVI